MSRIDDQDVHLFAEGTHLRMFDRLGAHPDVRNGKAGVAFAVWAPNATAVSVTGSWNDWGAGNPLGPLGESGIWHGFVTGAEHGATYKYRIQPREGPPIEKADPFAFRAEVPPATASIVWSPNHAWGDDAWLKARARRRALESPMSIYEVHLGSWRRDPRDPESLLGYREIAEPLADYAHEMGFTHVELLPITEHPFYGSWGYQTTGYFAPTSRYGPPDDLMYLIDVLHQRGIGVVLDWVPSHFPNDAHGLAAFDGTHLFEHADPRQGFHPDWNTLIFNYGRKEVQSFLLSSAIFWLERYHIDALRVDAVASMLYLDYSRRPGEWIPNQHGGRENLEAIDLLRRLNEAVYREVPGTETIAEESTAWPMVSRPTYLGGLGFGFKWDMGWMHDTLQYAAREPIYRVHHHNELTFRTVYAFTENFVLPLSHDEVVHGKGSLLGKMPGDEWQQRAMLRLLLGYMWSLPGKKLLFMGCEFGQKREWNHDRGLDWHLLEAPEHRGLQRWVRDLNTWYRGTPSLHRGDCEEAGFRWIDSNDAARSLLVYARHVPGERLGVIVAANFTPVPRTDVRIGVAQAGVWDECLNGDATLYGGSGIGNLGAVRSSPVGAHGHANSINVTLPPLAIVAFSFRGAEPSGSSDE